MFGMAVRTISAFYFFFFNDTATTEIYTLSLHDALPIWRAALRDDRVQAPARISGQQRHGRGAVARVPRGFDHAVDRLLHGTGHLLRADELDARAVQGSEIGRAHV